VKKYVVIMGLILLFWAFAPSVVSAEETLLPIMGKGTLTAEQMYKYLITYNKEDGLNPIDEAYAKEFVVTTIKEAAAEGVNADVAFALMMHETGYLNFGGDVVATQNNFGGLGATGGGVQGAAFADMQLGIRGVVQHLKCYGSSDALVNACVDPRFSESLRGKAIYVQWLGVADNPYGTGWASPGSGYGNRLVEMIGKIAAVDTTGVPAISLDVTAEEEKTGDQTLLKYIQSLTSGDIINFLIALALFALFLVILRKIMSDGKKKKQKPKPRSTRRSY